jgi:hypothetical protein
VLAVLLIRARGADSGEIDAGGVGRSVAFFLDLWSPPSVFASISPTQAIGAITFQSAVPITNPSCRKLRNNRRSALGGGEAFATWTSVVPKSSDLLGS